MRTKKTNCEKCPLSSYVAPELQKDSDILFIGEAPGAMEVTEGKLFCSRSGQLLREYIEKLHMKCSITTVVKCRPPGNKSPSIKEKKLCEEKLLEDIKFVNPKLIVTVGVTALQKITRKREVIKYNAKLCKCAFKGLGISVVVCVNPAYVLYGNPVELLDRAFNKVVLFFKDPLIPPYKIRGIPKPTEELVAMDIETSDTNPVFGRLRCFAVSTGHNGIFVTLEEGNNDT